MNGEVNIVEILTRDVKADEKMLNFIPACKFI